MNIKGFKIKETPTLTDPILIAGFDGWGNAMNVSAGMAAYLVNKFDARLFANITPDVFYQFDENRPIIHVEKGILKSVSHPGGAFYTARPEGSARDLVILEADEPSLKWFQFTDSLFSMCENLGVKTIITLGSLHDRVLHTDRVLSGMVSDDGLLEKLQRNKIHLGDYQGPGSIHSLLQSEGPERG
ncbi:MAG: PAC2 family protein, partial [Desulfobacterales bacterium]|nr:PAC2 family protein [Desulfobacterales bacterium]